MLIMAIGRQLKEESITIGSCVYCHVLAVSARCLGKTINSWFDCGWNAWYNSGPCEIIKSWFNCFAIVVSSSFHRSTGAAIGFRVNGGKSLEFHHHPECRLLCVSLKPDLIEMERGCHNREHFELVVFRFEFSSLASPNGFHALGKAAQFLSQLQGTGSVASKCLSRQQASHIGGPQRDVAMMLGGLMSRQKASLSDESVTRTTGLLRRCAAPSSDNSSPHVPSFSKFWQYVVLPWKLEVLKGE